MLKSDIRLYDEAYKTLLSYDFRENMKFDTTVLFLYGDEDTSCPSELLEKDTIGSYNSMLEKQGDGECVITTVLFDNNIVDNKDSLSDKVYVELCQAGSLVFI